VEGLPPGPRVLYILGSGRSGSTVLELLLGQLPGVTSVGELTYIWTKGVVLNRLCGCGQPFLDCPFWKEVGERAFGTWSAADPERMLDLHRRLTRPRSVAALLAGNTPREFAAWADVYGHVYETIGAVAGARAIVDSSKDLVDALLVRRLLGPRARFVHLVRDSRGVAFSWAKQVARPEVTDRRVYMPRHAPASAAVRWLVKNLVCAAAVPRDRAMFVRYESLACSPRTELALLAPLVGVPVEETERILDEPDILVRPTHSVSGNPLRFRSGPLRIEPDEAWRREMRRADRLLVTFLTWPGLLAFRGKTRQVGAAGEAFPAG
jgi:hypothetical protein